MKAYVTSIGEITTDLCAWSLERNGFEVVLIKDGSLLVDKLKTIYEHADDDFIRVDADVVVNQNMTPQLLKMMADDEPWWFQFMTFGWHAQDLIHGGVQFIKKEAIPHLRREVDRFHDADRPETALSRIKEFYEPRRFVSVGAVCFGIHGFAADDVDRVIAQKKKRGQLENYDFELAEKLMELTQ